MKCHSCLADLTIDVVRKYKVKLINLLEKNVLSISFNCQQYLVVWSKKITISGEGSWQYGNIWAVSAKAHLN